jgi:hypothetical protein
VSPILVGLTPDPHAGVVSTVVYLVMAAGLVGAGVKFGLAFYKACR